MKTLLGLLALAPEVASRQRSNGAAVSGGTMRLRMALRLRALLLVLFGALLPVGCGPKQQELHLLLWPEWLDPQLIAEFEQTHRCKVTVDLVEDYQTIIAKLEAGGGAVYDIVMPLNFIIPSMVVRGLLAPLRHEHLPNLGNLDPDFANTPFDPGNRHSVPYQWGSGGILIRKKPGKDVEETWGLFFDPARQPGSFLLFDDPRGCIEAALMFRGKEINTTNLVELEAARDDVVEAKKRSLGFANSIACRNRVVAQEVEMSMLTSPDGAIAMREDPELVYFVPREGGTLWFDNLAIPAGARNRDLAEGFINFTLDARVAARIATFNHASSPNRAAREFLPAEDRSNPALYPPPEVMKRIRPIRDLGPAGRVYDEIWTQIKSR